jgi:GNAT superfamily N-acetyltransferase
MENLTIRHCTFDEIERMPTIDALIAEYAAESSHNELPDAGAQWAHYKALEQAGAMTAIGAFKGDELVGFICVLASRVPHYGHSLAVTESFFVAKAHRKGGVGVKLLKAAEERAREVGATCLMVSAPAGGTLERVMPRMGYRHSNTVFVRSLT